MLTKQDLRTSNRIIIENQEYRITEIIESKSDRYGHFDWPVEAISVERTVPNPKII